MEIMMFQLGAYQTNCYVLCDETQKICAVIDPGDSGEALGAKIVELGYDVKAILLTHGHHDHTGGVEALHKAFPEAPIYLHPKDGREATTAMRSIVPELSVETVDYSEGDTVTVEPFAFAVLETPGHTPGSVVLQCGELLFTGDTLFAGSCGRTDFPGSNHKDMMASLARLYPLDGQVLSGHMGQSTMERERQSNPYLRQAMKG
ncbi:MBL fold metallo-hydrolase [Bengtsoniella intestinalis]|uniref:MBL fold metallo-hydrolase n=1 Tax=Bengtsoniella intestinalis TaxID=3073143 RepID=UPI00391EFF69